MVMQEGHKRFILVRSNDALRSVWGSSLVLSCTWSARSRGYQCVWDRKSVLGLGLSGGRVLVWVLKLLCCSLRVPERSFAFPFIVSRGGRVYIRADIAIYSGVQVEDGVGAVAARCFLLGTVITVWLSLLMSFGSSLMLWIWRLTLFFPYQVLFRGVAILSEASSLELRSNTAIFYCSISTRDMTSPIPSDQLYTQ